MLGFGMSKTKKEKIEGLERHKLLVREKEQKKKEKKQALLIVKHGSKR
jgi:hypothetical protein